VVMEMYIAICRKVKIDARSIVATLEDVYDMIV